MANTFKYQEIWTNEFEKSNFAMPVYPVLTDLQFTAGLKKGDTVWRRARANPIFANDLGSDGSYTVQNYAEGEDSFVINKQKEATVRIVATEVLHTDLNTTESYGRQLSNAIFQEIDGDVLYTAQDSAGTTIDAGNFNGTAGDGITVSISNVADIPVYAFEIFRGKNIVFNPNMRFGKMKFDEYAGMPMWVMPPQVSTQIDKYLMARGTDLGDKVVTNGYKGRFGNLECFDSNNLTFTTRLALGANPTDGDTMTVKGITFRFKDTLAANGDIKIGGTAAITADNIVAALNALQTGTANYDAWESSDTVSENGYTISKANALHGIVATDGTTYVDIAIKGAGKVTVSETFTSASNEFTAAQQCVQSIIAIGKNVSLAVRKDPGIYENPVSGAIARDYTMWTVYDSKMFTDQARAVIKVSVRCDATSFTAYSNVHA